MSVYAEIDQVASPSMAVADKAVLIPASKGAADEPSGSAAADHQDIDKGHPTYKSTTLGYV
jgi:hypothetical protein